MQEINIEKVRRDLYGAFQKEKKRDMNKDIVPSTLFFLIFVFFLTFFLTLIIMTNFLSFFF